MSPVVLRFWIDGSSVCHFNRESSYRDHSDFVKVVAPRSLENAGDRKCNPIEEYWPHNRDVSWRGSVDDEGVQEEASIEKRWTVITQVKPH